MKAQTEFIKLLRSTMRSGVDSVEQWLKDSDFFTAPASIHHGYHEEGLVMHSLFVAKQALALRKMIVNTCPEYASRLTEQSVLLVSLLHDVYVVDRFCAKEFTATNHQGETVQEKIFFQKQDDFPIGNGEKAVVLLLQHGLQLTDDEIVAIRWNMNLSKRSRLTGDARQHYRRALQTTPLLRLLERADTFSVGFDER